MTVVKFPQSTVKNVSAQATFDQQIKLPGDIAMWFFILAELTVFAVLFLSFAITEQLYPTLFDQGKQQLHQVSGLINTIALITSSYFVALAVRAMHGSADRAAPQAQRNAKAVKLLVVALGFACIYLLVKLWEYQALFALGITIETNTFFTLYFLITGFHFMHILLGMVILIYIGFQAKQGAYNESNTDAGQSVNRLSGFESGAIYWHMVDLLWIILFPLVYVI